MEFKYSFTDYPHGFPIFFLYIYNLFVYFKYAIKL